MIRTLFIAFMAFLVLSFFGVSIRNILESDTGRDNLTFIAELLRTIYSVIESYVIIFANNLKEIGDFVKSN